MSSADELVSVYQAANLQEAYFVKNLLAASAVDAQVVEANELFPGLSMEKTDVLVRRCDESQARDIVGKFDREQLDRAHRPDWTCPKCGATVIGAFDECDACGADRPGSESVGEQDPE